MPPGTTLPVAASKPIWPERNIKSPPRTASENGKSRRAGSCEVRNSGLELSAPRATVLINKASVNAARRRIMTAPSERADFGQKLQQRGIDLFRPLLLDPVTCAFDDHLLHARH